MKYILTCVCASVIPFILILGCSRSGDRGDAEQLSKVRFHFESPVAVPGGSLSVAIEVHLKKGWYTYWLNPGDAGMPPNVTWVLPRGWKSPSLELPIPRRFESDGIVSFGYADRVVYLATLEVPDSVGGDTVELRAHVTLLLCKEICIPFTDTLQVSLPVGSAGPPPGADGEVTKLFDEARRNMPLKEVVVKGAVQYSGDDRIVLRLPRESLSRFRDFAFFPIDQGGLDYSGKQEIGDDGRTITISLPLAKMQGKRLESIEGLLAGTDSRGAPIGVFVKAYSDSLN